MSTNTNIYPHPHELLSVLIVLYFLADFFPFADLAAGFFVGFFGEAFFAADFFPVAFFAGDFLTLFLAADFLTVFFFFSVFFFSVFFFFAAPAFFVVVFLAAGFFFYYFWFLWCLRLGSFGNFERSRSSSSFDLYKSSSPHTAF